MSGEPGEQCSGWGRADLGGSLAFVIPPPLQSASPPWTSSSVCVQAVTVCFDAEGGREILLAAAGCFEHIKGRLAGCWAGARGSCC